jgi:hypothetical protein
MNWTASTAKEIAERLTEEWNDVYARNVITHFNSEVCEIEAAAGGSRLKWRSKNKAGEREEAAHFDHVIFAVGYGLEPRGQNRRSYWENDSLDKTLGTDECVLIAGYGDGALTDLMRACLRKFDHSEFLTAVASAVTADILDKIKSIETDIRSSDAAYLTGEYRQLSALAVQDIMEPILNVTRHVTLTGQGPHLFDPRASALNRLVASQLLFLGAFQHCPIGESELIGAADNSDPVFTHLEEATGRRFSDVVLRFGVERTITKIKGLLPSSMERLHKAWDRIPPKLDPTRVPLWERFTPISENIDHSAVLFLSPSSDEDFLPEVVQRAVEDVPSPQIRDLRTIRLHDCFKSDEALFHTVRALCRSPVAIFALGKNMGCKNVGGMLLMGIRAAVRRGATVVVHEGKLAAADWSALPFNLKELQIYGLRKDEQLESAALVGAAIREGLAVLSSDSPGYRDMPVFDIVRRPTRRTERPEASKREVFVLCSFNKLYDPWQTLQLRLEGKEDGTGGRLSLKRVIDYVSPLLAGERLYELTRHAGTCLIDWTGWSPNVFFEMGVRLAVSSTYPVCLQRHGETGPNETAEQLMRLFKPLTYQQPGESVESFRASFLERVANLQPNSSETVYSVVERNLALRDEYGGRPLHEQLFTAANAMLGPDLANLNLLYGRNDRLRRQVLQSAFDSLVAARLLIDRKLESGSYASDPAALRELKEQIESLFPELQELLR